MTEYAIRNLNLERATPPASPERLAMAGGSHRETRNTTQGDKDGINRYSDF
jgi:hypothetical protein